MTKLTQFPKNLAIAGILFFSTVAVSKEFTSDTVPNVASEINSGNTSETSGGFFDRFRDLFRDQSRTENSRGNKQRNAGQYAKAHDHYLKATQINPNYARAHYNLGHMQFILQKDKEALKSLNRAIELHENGAGYTTRGVVRLALGDIAGALADQVKAARFAPAVWAVVPYNHGCAKMFAGDLTGAAESFAHAKILESPNSEINRYEMTEKMKQKVVVAKQQLQSKSSKLTQRHLQAVDCGVDIHSL